MTNFTNNSEPIIQTIGSPILRSLSKRQENILSAAKICRFLTDKLRELKGAGLAAPQIGLPYRIFVVEIRPTELFPNRESSDLYTMINPEVHLLTDEIENDFEACFSIPGYLGIVPRWTKLSVEWTDPDSSVQKKIFTGYLARVIQHEMDHLNGLVYLDRMNNMSSFTSKENFLNNRSNEQNT